MKTTVVYLLHRTGDMPAYHHARHYIGSAVDLDSRLAEHASGGGARLTQVWCENGAAFECVRTWKGGRQLERRLKGWHKGGQLCPVCNPAVGRRTKKGSKR